MEDTWALAGRWKRGQQYDRMPSLSQSVGHQLRPIVPRRRQCRGITKSEIRPVRRSGGEGGSSNQLVGRDKLDELPTLIPKSPAFYDELPTLIPKSPAFYDELPTLIPKSPAFYILPFGRQPEPAAP